MCKVPVKLRELVKQRLAAAAEEIFELLERTITEYEEEAERQRRLMETLQPRGLLNTTAESGPSCTQPSEWTPSLLLPPHIKQEALNRDAMTSQLWEREDTAPPLEFEEVLTTTQVSMKSEEEEAPETWTQPVYHNQTVDCPEPPVPVSASGDQLLNLYNTETEDTRGHTCRRFSCFFCHKSYTSNFQLQSHMRVHTGEKPFSCSVCGKRFSRKGDLKAHIMIHSDLKSFSCTVCGKAFVKKCNLNDHLLVHTGEKPFSCSVCGKPFRHKSNLNRHMSTHRYTL